MFARQLEARILVIERRGSPAVGGMAGGAVRAESAAMRIALGMAGGAVHGRALENTIDMTRGAGHRGMFARQLEGGIVMVKGRGLPSAR